MLNRSKRAVFSIVVQETWPITQPHNTAHYFVLAVVVKEQLAVIVKPNANLRIAMIKSPVKEAV